MANFYEQIDIYDDVCDVKEEKQEPKRIIEKKKNGEPRSHYSDPKYNDEKREKKNYEAYQQACLITLLNRYCAIVMQKRKRPSKMTLALPHIIGIEEKMDIDRNLCYRGENYIDLRELAKRQCDGRGVFNLNRGSNPSDNRLQMIDNSTIGDYTNEIIRKSSNDLSMRYKEEREEQHQPQRVAQRRMERIISIYIHNILLDFLETKGYFFETKLSKQPTNGLQLERIMSFSLINETKDGKPVHLNKQQIEMIGEKMFDFISTLCENMNANEKKMVIEQNDSSLANYFHEVLVEANIIDEQKDVLIENENEKKMIMNDSMKRNQQQIRYF